MMTAIKASAKPLPVIDAMSRPYWQALKAREIRLPRCLRCQALQTTQFERACPSCGHDRFEWTKMNGRGTIWSHCVFHRDYLPGFETPYNVAVVELAEGPRLITNIVEAPALHIGLAVEPVFEDVTDAVTLLKFRPAAS